MRNPRVQVVVASGQVPEALRGALRQVGATASFTSPDELVRGGPSGAADAIIFIPPDQSPDSDLLDALLDRAASLRRPTLVLAAKHDAEPPARSGTPGPAQRIRTDKSGRTPRGHANIEFLTPDETSMLAGRLDALIQRSISEEPESHVASPFVRYRRQLALASAIRRQLMPAVLPRTGGLSFRAAFRSADQVSGDCYDFRRLDREHVGLMLADAVGHGLPAALLSLFMKRAMSGVSRTDGRPTMLRPELVLARLNRELLAAGFRDGEFVTAVYVVLNVHTRRGWIGRAGAPHPIVRRRDGGMEFVRPVGMLLGVEENPEFVTETIALETGDALVLYTDGLDAIARMDAPPCRARGNPRPLVRPLIGAPVAALGGLRSVPLTIHAMAGVLKRFALSESGVGEPDEADFDAAYGDSEENAVDSLITRSQWFARLRRDGPAAALAYATARHDVLRRLEQPVDDLTLLTISA